jgi:lysophospholipase L1-like esterase
MVLRPRSVYTTLMKRLFGVVALLAVLLIGVIGVIVWQRPRIPVAYAPLGPGDTYLALGDSLAAGWTVGDPSESYVGRIATQLKSSKPDIDIRNLSVPGETSGSFRSGQLQAATEFIRQEQAAGRRVSPITLDIGGNDANAVRGADDATRTRTIKRVQDNLGVILDELLVASRSPSGDRTADVVVMNYYNPYGGDPADQTSPAYWSDQLNQAIARAAADRGIPVADVASEFGGGLAYRYTYIVTGDIHANADGHRVIASEFWEALRYPGTLAQQP